MGYTGGDILEVTYIHETIGSGRFFCKSNEDSTINLGGFMSNDDANSIASNGRLINQLNRIRGSFEATIAWDMIDNDELDKLRQLTSDPKDAEWTISSITGAVWRGKGRPVGDLVGNLNTALIPLKIAFEGEVQKLT